MSTENNETARKENSYDVMGLLLDYLAHWKWFVISVVVVCILGYIFICTKTPIYKVDASIYLSEDNASQSDAFNMGGNNPMVALKDYIDETELEVMKSRNNVLKIVKDLDLEYTYSMKGGLRNKQIYKTQPVTAIMDSASLEKLSYVKVSIEPSNDSTLYDIDVVTELEKVKESQSFSDVTLPMTIKMSTGTLTLVRNDSVDFKGTELIKIVSPRAMATTISKKLTIDFAKNSEKIIRISILTDVPNKGKDIIESLVKFYNADIIEDKNRSAIQTEAFIIDRLVMITHELADVEERLRNYRQKHNVTDMHIQTNLNLSLKSNYQKELAEVDAELALLADIERIANSGNGFQLLPSAAKDQTVSSVIESYNKKLSQYYRTKDGSTADNPLVKSLQEELTRDKGRILANIATAKRGLANQRNSFAALENQSVGALSSTPSIDKGLQEIFREQEVKVNIYTFLLQRREEIALQKTLATNSARLIDDPVSTGPVSPKVAILMVIFFLLGLAIPAGIIFIRRLLFPVFADQEELSRLTNVPILGEICESKDSERDEIVVGENVSSPIAELFRLLRNNISFTRNGSTAKVILVTSTVSGEGKTFVASNLAMTYALAGKKVIVVGLDLRRPMLSVRLGFNNHSGVTTYLSGQNTDLHSLIQQSHLNPNLYILPGGPMPPNPNELIMSDRMDNMFEKLRREFDYVIVDSAPIGVISDTFLITRFTDIQLYVQRADYSTRNGLKTLHAAFESGKFKSPYIVLNGVNIHSNAYIYRRYGDYGHYGKSRDYNYGYGYSKGKEKKK